MTQRGHHQMQQKEVNFELILMFCNKDKEIKSAA